MLDRYVMPKPVVVVATLVIIGLAVVAAVAVVGPGQPQPEPSPVSLPGAEEFGLTKAELVNHIEAVEQGIAACMNTAGFQYVPVDYLTVRKSMDADKKVAGLTDDAFREQFGYGITTPLAPAGTVPQLSGPDHAATIGLGSENVRVFTSLSPADQSAYNRALFGENTAATFATALEAEDFSQIGGCTRSAVEQVFDPHHLGAAYVNPGDALIVQDARVIAATVKWSGCMREAGFNYHTPEAIEPALKDRLVAITGGADPRTLTPDAHNALTELQGEEKTIAVADFECAEQFIEPAVKQVETELYGAPQN